MKQPIEVPTKKQYIEACIEKYNTKNIYLKSYWQV